MNLRQQLQTQYILLLLREEVLGVALVVAAAVEARVLQVVLVAQAELADMAAVLLFLGLLVFYSCQGVLMYLRQMVAETVRLVHRHRQPRMVV